MSIAELERSERDAFLDWRRRLADLQDEKDLVLTPFERNLEVWRQLWRVIEKSDLAVQIVDARNPLRFWCEDLDRYVQELDVEDSENASLTCKRGTILLLNKADLLTGLQR
jgi:large subunit GTPase 1